MSGPRARPLVRALIALGCIAAAVPAAQASPILGILDYQGFVYETTPFGTAGSVLSGVGTVDTFFFPFQNPLMYYTWAIADLVGAAGVDVGGGSALVQYSGGTFRIYEDAVNNANYDAVPGNGQADPAGFDDGTPWLLGEFANFEFYWNDGEGLGNFGGDVVITGGLAAPYFASQNAFTFGGATSRALTPEGYPRKVDGAIEGPLVPEPSSLMLLAVPLLGWAGLRVQRGCRSRRG